MEDAPCCPLCTEELDDSDLGFFPCRCRFQVCPFCYGRLKEGGGLCPGCRAPYKDQEPIYEKPDLEKLREQREEIKRREREEKQQASKTLDSLANVRVIQRNLVYVTGLPLKHAYDDVLAGPKWFKPYGRILKCVANRSVQYNSNSPCGPTVSAYVTYSKHEEALEAIKKLDNTMHEGHNLRCSFGTTKYCNNFLRGLECTNPDCMYLHKVQENDDTYLRAQLSRNQDSRSRSEFHDKTHPQFVEQQDGEYEEEYDDDYHQTLEQQPQAQAQNHTTGVGVPLPAPLPPTTKDAAVVEHEDLAPVEHVPPAPTPAVQAAPPAVAAPVTAPTPAVQAAPTHADPLAPQIPIPRPVRPQVGPPSGGLAPSMPFKSSAPISAPGSAPWSSAPVQQQPQYPHEHSNNVIASSSAGPAELNANSVDPVASVANAALSTNSLFSAFANSQAAPGPPGLEPNRGLWPSASETSWQSQPSRPSASETSWQSQPSSNSVFGGSNFSLWGGSGSSNNGSTNDGQRGLGADLWGNGAAQHASTNQSFMAPPSSQQQPQAASQPGQVADWQSAFRALLPDVNVHFEGSQQKAAAASVAPAAPSGMNIWGTSSGDTNIVQNQGNSGGLTWNLPAMLQPQAQAAHSTPSNGMDPLWSQNNNFNQAPTIPTIDQTIVAPASQPSGSNAGKKKGGKKRGKK